MQRVSRITWRACHLSPLSLGYLWFKHCNKTTLEFEAVNTKDKTLKYRAKVVTKRNDSRLNNHQQIQLQGWRANCDIQIIIDHHACYEYLAKYAAKSEPKSPVLCHTFNSIMLNVDKCTAPHKAIKSHNENSWRKRLQCSRNHAFIAFPEIV